MSAYQTPRSIGSPDMNGCPCRLSMHAPPQHTCQQRRQLGMADWRRVVGRPLGHALLQTAHVTGDAWNDSLTTVRQSRQTPSRTGSRSSCAARLPLQCSA